MKILLTFIVSMLAAILPAMARHAAVTQALPPDSLTIGFVTCYPGPEIFELYGHEAVRVSGRVDGRPIDVVFNYGLFDFNSPGFVYRFVKGETDYNIGAQHTELFLMSYRERGSKVVERVLPLTQQEARRMFEALKADIQPGADTYRYKYFTANCATKPLEHLESITNGRLRPKQDARDVPTYRDLLRQYNDGYPWYQLGIDLVLGTMLDSPASPEQASFVPMELDTRYFSEMPERVLEPGQGDGNQRGAPTPWFLAPLFVAWLVFAIVLCFVLKQWYRSSPAWDKRSCAIYTLWYALQGLSGALVWFLTFCSEHEGTSSNLNAIWLNPIWIFIAVLAWLPACRKVAKWLMVADGALTLVMLVAWPLLPQGMNAAVLPMMLTTCILSFRPFLTAKA